MYHQSYEYEILWEDKLQAFLQILYEMFVYKLKFTNMMTGYI